MKKFYQLLAIALLSLSYSCIRSDQLSDIDRLGAVTQGMSLKEVEESLGPEHRLQFHVLEKSVDCLCLSYAFGKPYILLYFVFKNGTLDKISEPPPFEYHDIEYNGDSPEMKGSKISIRVPVDPWNRMEITLKCPDLSGHLAVDSILKRCPKDETSLAIVPVFIIAAPILPFLLVGRANEYRVNKRTEEKYDPQKIVMTSSSNDVLGLYGAPVKSGEVNGLLVDTFGIDNHLSLIDPSDVAPFFNVVYDKFGKVRAVFSDDFYPKSK
jgi:hypothetical protein